MLIYALSLCVCVSFYFLGVTPPRSRRFLRRGEPFLAEEICGVVAGNRTKEDYRLVFLNGADWSSDDGGGGRQTSSSLSADDDCDWDYFMAGLDDDNSQPMEPLQQQHQQQQQQQRWQQSAGGAGTTDGGGSGGGGAGDDDDDQSTGCGGGDVGSSKPSETDAPATTFVPVVLPFPVFVPVPIVIQSERAQHTLTAAAFANVLTEYFRDRDADGNKRHVNDDGAPAGGGFVVADMPEPPEVVAATAAVVDDGGGAVLTMYSARAAGLDAKPSAAVCADDDRDAEIGYYSSSSSSASSTSDDSDGARHVAMSYDVNDSPNDDIIDDDIDDDDDDGCNVKLSSILDAAAVAAVKCAAASNSSASDEFSGTESMEQIPVDESAATAAGSLSGRFTSLITITRDDDGGGDERRLSTVNVVTNDTTKIMVPDVVVKDEGGGRRFKLTLDTSEPADESEVTVVTGGGTLSSAVVALEEGLADDDSWVEEDLDRDDFRNESSEGEQHMSFEDEPPEYGRRSALDFTLHTIVEESCEESETESDHRNNQTELEKYFFFGLCGQQDRDEVAAGSTRATDTFSETSSIVSDGLESLPDSSVEPSPSLPPPPSPSQQTGGGGTTDTSAVGSRLERYFLTEFMGFDRPDSDGSVGSDSPEHSPEQRRKRLVRARGTGRQHSSSLDNVAECCEQQTAAAETTATAMTTVQPSAEHDDASTSSSDSNDELDMLFEKIDGQFDTVKRGKKKKRCVVMTAPPLFGVSSETDGNNADGGRGEEAPEQQRTTDDNVVVGDALEENITVPPAMSAGSITTVITTTTTSTITTTKTSTSSITSAAAAGGLSRTDSFNDWSSDEETNLMMCKMRAFFKTMLADRPGPEAPGETSKPPQLVKFESELTRLMKTVPGIRDEQVKEIVEYLSSEDTWSDSYDSSDYTSSDLETTGSAGLPDDNGDAAFVYQKLMASLRRIDVPSSDSSASRNSPPLVTKVMQHIGSRLVALMHAVSESPGAPLHAASSGYRHHYQHQHQHDHHHQHHHHHHHHHRRSSRRHGRASTAATTIPVAVAADEDDDGDGGGIDVRYGVGVGVGGGGVVDGSPLPRSKSHDPLLEELARQEASDNERFSWRGSFESTLMMSDSRTRLTSSGESCATLAAKRRSAGDLLIKSANSSREQLDRVRSCGSIGGSVEDRIWRNGRRRGSVPDSGDSAGDSDSGGGTAAGHGSKSTTLPRNLQQASAATVAAVVGSSSNTNSLPRLPTVPASAPSPLTGIYKAHSVHQFNVKSARYRPPGYKNAAAATPPRREYNNNRRRTAAQHTATSSSLSTSPLSSSSTSTAATSVSSNNKNNNFNYNGGFQSPSTGKCLANTNFVYRGALFGFTWYPTLNSII